MAMGADGAGDAPNICATHHNSDFRQPPDLSTHYRLKESMSNTTVILGNLANEPQLRDTASRPVCNFRIASNRRYFDATTQDWKENESLFLDVSCWGNLAENVAQTLHKGDAVIVHGRLRTEEFTPQGTDRVVSVVKLTATTVGKDLRYMSAADGTSGARNGE